MKMSKKRIGGVIAMILGVGLLSFAMYGTYEMNKTRRNIDKYTGFAPKSKTNEWIATELHGKVDEYKNPVRFLFAGGIVLLVGGCVFYVRGRSKMQP